MMATQSVSVGEERDLIDPIEQTARATERAASGIGEVGGPAIDAATTVSDQVMHAGLELMQRGAETVQHVLQCGARLAARLSERSADQFGRAVGISGENADQVAQKTARNLQAIMQSGTVLTEITQRLCEQWADIGAARTNRAFDRVDAFLQCRTPQDFIALEIELMRDNMETCLDYARKSGEHAARLAGGARRQSANVAGDRRGA